MTLRHLLLALVGGALAGCASQSTPVAREPATSLLIGSGNSGARVLIRRVDDGPTLWVSEGMLGSKVSIRPGHHKVEVMCQFAEAGAMFAPGEFVIDVEPGHVYDLVGSLARNPTRCDVAVTRRG